MTNQEFDAAIERILKGDKEGLKAIYEAYVAYIYAVFYDLVKNRENAEDLTTEFFIRLWKAAGSFTRGSGHKVWITTIARNMGIDFLRKAKNEQKHVESVIAESETLAHPSPEQQVVGSMNFKDALKTLAEPDRQILMMKIAGQMTFKEIAEVLKMPMGTVTWKYQNSLKELRRVGA